MVINGRGHSDQQSSPLLVTGEMRSGTTLVTNFLNSQEGCVVYSDLLRTLFLEAEALGIVDLTARLSERERNILLSSLAAEGWQRDISGLSEIARDRVHTWFDAYLLALRTLDPEGTELVLGTKITREYRYIDRLLDLGVHIVFCIRDPRDMLLSAKNRFADYNLFRYADWWRSSYQLAKTFAGRKNFTIVLFENLLDSEKRPGVLMSLSEFLGLRMEEGLRELKYGRDTRFVSNTSFGDVKKLFDPQAGWRWKRHYYEPEVIFTSEFLKQEIKELGLETHDFSYSAYRSLHLDYIRYRAKTKVKKSLLKMYRHLFRS